MFAGLTLLGGSSCHRAERDWAAAAMSSWQAGQSVPASIVNPRPKCSAVLQQVPGRDNKASEASFSTIKHF